MVFNPLVTWPWKGPFTKLFRSFLWCNLQLSSKITILGYVSTCTSVVLIQKRDDVLMFSPDYALALSFPMTVLNYFITGWYNPYLDKYYMNSWQGTWEMHPSQGRD